MVDSAMWGLPKPIANRYHRDYSNAHDTDKWPRGLIPHQTALATGSVGKHSRDELGMPLVKHALVKLRQSMRNGGRLPGRRSVLQVRQPGEALSQGMAARFPAMQSVWKRKGPGRTESVGLDW